MVDPGSRNLRRAWPRSLRTWSLVANREMRLVARLDMISVSRQCADGASYLSSSSTVVTLGTVSLGLTL